jgi:hypothetical protein
MRKIRNTAIIVLAGLLFSSQIALAQMKPDMPAGESKVANNIKATLAVTPSKSMVDLVLVGAKDSKTITAAKVAAQIKGPDGNVQKKDLLGMKMGEVFSYMNTLDMSKKGSYSFVIAVEVEKEKVKFNFVYEVK